MCDKSAPKKFPLPYALLNCPIRFNPFQYDAYRCYWEENKKNIFITDDVGLGKTIEVGIITKEKLEREYDNSAKILIIVPKFLCIQWKEQLQKLFHISAKIAENGELDRGCYQVYILPLSQLKKCSEKSNSKFEMIIVDEVHYYRNRESARYRYLNELLRNNNGCHKLFLSATPINNSYADWETEMELFGETPVVVHNKKAEAFPGGAIRKKESVYCDLNEKEQQFYDTTDSVRDDEFGKTVYRHIGSSSLYALQQCYNNNEIEFMNGLEEDFEEIWDENEELKCDDTKIEELDEEDDSKAKKLVEKIRRLDQDKIIVFAHYLETCKHLCAYLFKHLGEEYKLFSIPVKIPEEGREDEKKYEERLSTLTEQEGVIERFKKASKAIMVCSDMLKEGVNLQCAKVLINYDLPFNPAILEQRIGRIDRVGQQDEIFIYNFIVNKTYDTTVYYRFILGKLKIVKYYQEKGLVSKMEISEENSSENSFKNAVKKALENCENKDTEKKKIKDDLIIFILENESQSTDRKVWKERFNELEKKEAEDIIKEVCDLLAKKNKDMEKREDEEAFCKKKEEFRDTHEDVLGAIAVACGKEGEKEYHYKIQVDKEKVKEIWKNGRKRTSLGPVIENYSKLIEQLKDTQNLSGLDELEIKDSVDVGYEYLNPDVNLGKTEKLPEWDDYIQKYIPLEIVKEIIKR